MEDNTPIAITIDNGVLISWTNLVTGIVTAGNPPAGTGICEVPSTVTTEIAPLTCIKDAVTICPGEEPIPVTAVDFDIRDLVFATDKVDVSGSSVVLDAATLAALETITALQGTSPWVVSGTVSVTEPVTVDGEVALNAATLAALETITALQGTSPWVIGGTVSVTEPVTVDGEVALDAATLAALETTTVLQGTSPWVVSGTLGVTGEVEVKNDTGNPLPIDDAQSNKRFQPGVRITTAIAISSLGNNTIVTPAAGMRLRVTWIGMSTSEVGLETLAIVKFGAAGSAKYRWYLGAPGAFSHWEAIEGAVNEALIVNLSIGTTVQVNVTYEEF